MLGFSIAVITVVSFCFYYALHSSKKEPRKNPIPNVAYEWPDNGDECDIVGESYYQDAIKLLAGPDDENIGSKKFKAFLIPEDNNPYDNKAVRVDIDGMTVGYFGREDARSFRRRLGAKKLSGQITACKAVVIGGRGPRGEQWNYDIFLSIEAFDW
ncbi:MAG: hypothetical protein ABS69_15420 [Nitrosomonadales bacterium SCN 54-20]|nr:MAG: hypothetical protein ABS69_15420 [Nitrosomonadales bacterium SCN 54-20]